MRRLVLALVVLATPLAFAQTPSRADAFAAARDATWAIALLRMAPKGQIDQAAFVGTGFFVSRNHFVTAAHVVNARLLGRTRTQLDQIRVFKNELAGDGFNHMKVVFEDADLDLAILQSAINAKNWLSISLDAPREGDEVGLYGYPLVEFANLARATAFALGRVGMVAGFDVQRHGWEQRQPCLPHIHRPRGGGPDEPGDELSGERSGRLLAQYSVVCDSRRAREARRPRALRHSAATALYSVASGFSQTQQQPFPAAGLPLLHRESEVQVVAAGIDAGPITRPLYVRC
jgi:hypothetical protein